MCARFYIFIDANMIPIFRDTTPWGTANHIPVYTVSYPTMRKSLSIIAFNYVTVLQNKILYLEMLICSCDLVSGTVARIVQN
jgi:hypothetical protein